MKIQQTSDCAVTLQVDNSVGLFEIRRLHALVQQLDQENIPGIVQCTFSYLTLMIVFQPWIISGESLVRQLKALFAVRFFSPHLSESPDKTVNPVRTVVAIPVCYGSQFGPDLDTVAEYHGITQGEVID